MTGKQKEVQKILDKNAKEASKAASYNWNKDAITASANAKAIADSYRTWTEKYQSKMSAPVDEDKILSEDPNLRKELRTML